MIKKSKKNKNLIKKIYYIVITIIFTKIKNRSKIKNYIN